MSIGRTVDPSIFTSIYSSVSIRHILDGVLNMQQTVSTVHFSVPFESKSWYAKKKNLNEANISIYLFKALYSSVRLYYVSLFAFLVSSLSHLLSFSLLEIASNFLFFFFSQFTRVTSTHIDFR